jgi:hypothetical protein
VEKNYQLPLLMNAALIEVINLPTIAILTLLGNGSILATILYAYFLMVRYALSLHTQNAFKVIRSGCDYYALNPRCPAILGRVYTRVRDRLVQFGESSDLIRAVRLKNEVRETRGR